MGRAPCCDKNGLKKGPWTTEEDQKLVDYIRNHGSGNWRTLPKNAGLQRCGKSCRLRWTNYLRPDIKRGKFSLQEEETIVHLHSILGNKWSAIASRLPGRTDNEIKNYWNTHIRKRLLRMGIDPVTHSPRLDLLDLSSILNPSFYNHQYTNPNSQFGMARLLGLQQLVNPEILKFATTIFSNSLRPATQNDPNNLCIQDQHAEETPSNSEIQNQVNFHTSHEQFVQTCQPQTADCAASVQAFEPISESLDHFQPYNDLLDFGFDPQCYANFAGDLPNLLDTDIASQHNYVVTSYDNLMYRSNDQSFSCGSLSGPSSSPTPLNSNSNSNSNSTYITTEDERESYCSSNFMKFEIPADLLDVNEFL